MNGGVGVIVVFTYSCMSFEVAVLVQFWRCGVVALGVLISVSG